MSPLVAYGAVDPILVNVLPPRAGTTDLRWGPAGSANAAEDYFMGGYVPVTYALVAPTTDGGATQVQVDAAYNAGGATPTSAFVIEIDKDTGMISYKPRQTTTAPTEVQYQQGTTFHVQATDDIKAKATTPIIAVKPNRAPEAGGAIEAVNVGTQDGFNYPASADTEAKRAEYAANNPCMNFRVVCVAITVSDDRTSTTEHFLDEDSDGLSFATTDEDPMMATSSVSSNTVTVTGLSKTTLADSTATPAVVAVPAIVAISATDKGNLTTPEADVQNLAVNVDPAPQAIGMLNDGQVLTLKTGTTGNTATLDVSSYFSDESLQGVTLTYSVTIDGKSTDTERPDIIDVNEFSDTDGTFEFTAVNPGTAKVVVKVTETDGGGTTAIGQSATQELTIRVNSPS